MLSHPFFYHRTIRSAVVAFGSMFKDIQVVKQEKDSRNETQRQTVPLTYSNKETFVQRYFGDTDLSKPTQIVLPQMAFELKDIRYDVERKLSPFLNNALCQTGDTKTQFKLATPYQLDFQLDIYIRNVEDGLQIIEQILPFFNPDFTLSVKYVSCEDCSISEDMPFTLKGVTMTNTYEGPSETVRYMFWTLLFTANVLFYGPVASDAAIIKEVKANVHNMTTNTQNVYINVQPDPPTANVTDDFGFTTIIQEFDKP